MATSEIVLVPLDTWAKEHLTSLITAKTQDAFDQAFESFISKEVKVTINGAHLTREQYKEQLQNERGSAQLASINIEDIVLAPILNTNETTRSGLVGIFYTASFTQTSPINEHTTTSSLNIQVREEGPSHAPGGTRGGPDRRQVVYLDQVLVNKQVPVLLPQASTA